jgi:hypothetical protein
MLSAKNRCDAMMPESNSRQMNTRLFVTGVVMDMFGVIVCAAAFAGADFSEFISKYQWPIAAIGAVFAVTGFMIMNKQLKAVRPPKVIEKRNG